VQTLKTCDNVNKHMRNVISIPQLNEVLSIAPTTAKALDRQTPENIKYTRHLRNDMKYLLAICKDTVEGMHILIQDPSIAKYTTR